MSLGESSLFKDKYRELLLFERIEFLFIEPLLVHQLERTVRARCQVKSCRALWTSCQRMHPVFTKISSTKQV